MKATELRIGNYIEEKGKLKQMYSISNHNAKDYSKIKPISLTEEWLLKFGFDETLNGFWDEYECFSINNGEFRLGVDFLCYIKHVHQLQNIYFALTNEELILK